MDMVTGVSYLNQSQSTTTSQTVAGNQDESIDFHDQLMQAIADKKADIAEKIRNGETEESFQIGGSSLTIKEWEKLMNKVDKQIDSMKQIVEEEVEKKKKEAISTESIDKKVQNSPEN